MTTEQWKPVAGFDGRYLVSDGGRIRSIPRIVAHGSKLLHRPEYILRPRVVGAGYLQVVLQRDCRRYCRYVHVLVAQLYCQKPAEATEVNHDDLDKTNNAATNLFWTTRIGNMRHGRLCYPDAIKGNRKLQRTLILERLAKEEQR